MRGFTLTLVSSAAVLLQGCSSMPREFTPMLATAPADQAAFDSAQQGCREQVAQGKLVAGEKGASAKVAAATGATTAVVGTVAASSATGFLTGAAIAAATIAALPLTVVGGAWGMAKSKKAKKEKELQRATAACLETQGYSVSQWKVAGKGD